jgi:hypothetical protein
VPICIFGLGNNSEIKIDLNFSIVSEDLGMFENLNPFELLKEEMENDEVAIRVNAIHRLKTVVTVLGGESFKSQILPYIEGWCLLP